MTEAEQRRSGHGSLESGRGQGRPKRDRSPLRRGLVVVVVVASVAVVVAAGLTVASLALSRTEHRTHVLRGTVSRVAVVGDSGDVRLRSATAPDVEVRETRRYWLGKPKLRLSLRAGMLVAAVRCPRFAPRCADDLEVTVPAGVREASVDVDSGDVEVSGLDARTVTAHSDSGDISGERLRSATVAGTSDSGDVRLALDATPRTVKARTDSGDVEVTVPTGRYRIDAKTDSGDVNLDRVVRDDRAANRIDASSDSGDVAVRGG